MAGAYPSFGVMKRLGAFVLSPGWNANPYRRVTTNIKFAGTHLFIYFIFFFFRYSFMPLSGEGYCEGKVSYARTQHNVPEQGSNLERSIRRRAPKQ